MTVKEFIVKEVKRSGNSVFDWAEKMPADKLEWKPLDSGRSALDLAQECAYCPLWSVGLLQNRGMGDINMEEVSAKYNETRKAWTTVEDCRKAFAENVAILEPVLEAFPESDLEQEIDLPWGRFSFASIMFIPAWNCHYHGGQVNYIQTLYGDYSM